MSIPIGSNFLLGSGIPLDGRTVVADTTARDAIPAIERYDGLIVYTTATSKNYQLRGGVLNANWVDITSGAVVPAALTKVDDTNVTLTLGGTPATSLLQAVSLTLGWTGNLAYSRIQNVSNTSRILGRITAGAGTIEELTGTQATSLLDTFAVGATTKGLVPGSNSVGTTYFLRADSSWAVPPGTYSLPGTVVQTNKANTYSGTNLQTFLSSYFAINNPANTFAYTFVGAALTASHSITLPLLTGDDTLVTKDFSQTLTNKTIAAGSNTISGLVNANLSGSAAITYANLQQVSATNRLLGRITAGAGSIEELTGTQVTSLLDTFATGATTKGLVAGSNSVGATYYLNGNGAWTIPVGTSQWTTIGSDIYYNTGNVGIGMAPNYKLSVNGDIAIANDAGAYRIRDSANNALLYMSHDGTDMIVSNEVAGGLILRTTGTDRLHIQSGGNVGIGTTTPATRLHVIGVSSFGQNTNGTAVIDAYGGLAYFGCNTASNGIGVNSTGAITITSTATATNFILSSDKRLKTDIQPLIPEYVDTKYKQFQLISEPGVIRSGVIAQELQETNPELVRENGDGILSVAYIDLLIKEIAWLKNEVIQLKERMK